MTIKYYQTWSFQGNYPPSSSQNIMIQCGRRSNFATTKKEGGALQHFFFKHGRYNNPPSL